MLGTNSLLHKLGKFSFTDRSKHKSYSFESTQPAHDVDDDDDTPTDLTNHCHSDCVSPAPTATMFYQSPCYTLGPNASPELMSMRQLRKQMKRNKKLRPQIPVDIIDTEEAKSTEVISSTETAKGTTAIGVAKRTKTINKQLSDSTDVNYITGLNFSSDITDFPATFASNSAESSHAEMIIRTVGNNSYAEIDLADSNALSASGTQRSNTSYTIIDLPHAPALHVEAPRVPDVATQAESPPTHYAEIVLDDVLLPPLIPAVPADPNQIADWLPYNPPLPREPTNQVAAYISGESPVPAAFSDSPLSTTAQPLTPQPSTSMPKKSADIMPIEFVDNPAGARDLVHAYIDRMLPAHSAVASLLNYSALMKITSESSRSDSAYSSPTNQDADSMSMTEFVENPVYLHLSAPLDFQSESPVPEDSTSLHLIHEDDVDELGEWPVEEDEEEEIMYEDVDSPPPLYYSYAETDTSTEGAAVTNNDEEAPEDEQLHRPPPPAKHSPITQSQRLPPPPPPSTSPPPPPEDDDCEWYLPMDSPSMQPRFAKQDSPQVRAKLDPFGRIQLERSDVKLEKRSGRTRPKLFSASPFIVRHGQMTEESTDWSDKKWVTTGS